MKKIFWVFMLCLLAYLPITRVNAADLEVARDGWDKVGEVEVQVIQERFNLKYAHDNDGITLNGDFRYDVSTVYEDSAYTDGTFDRERNDKLSFPSFVGKSPIIVYTGALAVAGDDGNRINGSIVIKFEKAAKLQNGTYCDITMTVDNILIKNGVATEKPILILYGNSTVVLGVAYSNQEALANELTNAHNFNHRDIGAEYDVSFKITKTGTNDEIKNNMAIAFKDLDVYDKTIPGNEAVGVQKYSDDNNVPFRFTESITLINGVDGKVHLTDNSTVRVSRTDFGENTKYSAAKGDSASEISGFITLVNTNNDNHNFKLRWSGSTCGTGISFVSTKKIVTEVIGDYPNNVKITPTDNEVFWRENWSTVMTPDRGYVVSRIVIDDVEIDYTSLELNAEGKKVYVNNGVTYTFVENNGVVTYVFDNVIKNHSIKVAVTKTNYRFHYNPNGGVGTMDDTVSEYDVKGNISKNLYTRVDYEFVGWKAYYKNSDGKMVELKDSNGNVITFKDQGEYINLVGPNNEEVTLYAQWVKIENPKTGLFMTIISVLLVGAISVGAMIYFGEKMNNSNNV